MAVEYPDSAFEVEVSSPEPPPADPPSPGPGPVDPPADESAPGADPDAGSAGAGGAEPDDEPEAVDANASDAGKKLAGRKKSLQERLAQETWEKHEARRKAAELEAQIEALKKPAEPPTPQTAAADPNDPEPREDDPEFDRKYATYGAFVSAHARWAARQEFRALRERDARESADRAYQSRVSDLERKGTEAHADFIPKLTEFAQRGGRFGPFLTDVIQTHEMGHSIAYALASDPALIAKIEGAPTFAHASVELGRLVARLEGAPTGSPSPAVTATRANPPISPVGSSPVVAEPDPTSVTDFDEYFRRQNERDKASGRRR